MMTCTTFSGHLHSVPASELILRPSVYARISFDGRIALVIMQNTGLYGLLGGAVELGERREAALTYEVREEMGLQVAVGRLLHVETNTVQIGAAEPSGKMAGGFQSAESSFPEGCSTATPF